MLVRPTEIMDLPHEMLKECFVRVIHTAPLTVISLRCVCRFFKEVVELMSAYEFSSYLGSYQSQLFKNSLLSTYSGTFFKMLDREKYCLENRKKIEGVSLTSISIKIDDVFLPKSIDYFIVAAVSARAYEDLYAFYEEIRLSYRDKISIKRIIESIYLQALMNYNEIELFRLNSFIPIEEKADIGYACFHDGVGEYVYRPLADHASRFGNTRLAQALSLVERISPQ